MDLALTDIKGVKAKVLPKIADHSIVLVSLVLGMPKTSTHSRRVWSYAQADWELLSAKLWETDWN